MSRFESITIREVESSDVETFYEHQLDPEALRMAAMEWDCNGRTRNSWFLILLSLVVVSYLQGQWLHAS